MPEQLFEADDMAADCALGDIQRLRASGKTELLPHRIERAKGIEREPAAIDRAIVGDDKLLAAGWGWLERKSGAARVRFFGMRSCSNAIW